jgi:hypothetical protein
MGLIVQQKALQAAEGLQPLLAIIRKVDRDLVGRNRCANLDIALDQVCAMSWRLSGR